VANDPVNPCDLVPSPAILETENRWGITELPDTSARINSHPELVYDDVTKLVELTGVRVAWTRASVCPCSPVNDQTQQPDPLCTLCQGGGAFYFGPKDYAAGENVGVLTNIQKVILVRDGAAVIRGLMQKVTQAQDFYDRLGNWVRGTQMLTVRPENKIGYYDRLVCLDQEINYSEIIVQGADPTAALKLRYLATAVNIIRSETTRYEQGSDFDVVDGKVVWISVSGAPAANTRLSVHYLTHPTYLVIDHPHVMRGTQKRRKSAPLATPFGNPVALPIQAAIRLEFLQADDIGRRSEGAS
jgi:hypothetical protein